MRIGTVLELGLIPCKVCGERHVRTHQGKDKADTWEMDGHSYQQMDARNYIQIQRDEYNAALKEIRRLKSKIHKLERAGK